MGGGGSSSAPRFDAAGTAQAQTQSNINTGIANALLSNTNQITPWGSLRYAQTGTTNVDGHEVPSFTATQELDPTQQNILNKTNNLQNTALDYAGPLLNRVGSTVGSRLSFGGAPEIGNSGIMRNLSRMALDNASGIDPTALRDKGYEALMGRTRTELDRSREGQQTQLANQGIAAGSEAWRRAMEGQDQALIDASNQATINAGNLALQDASIAGTRGNLFGQVGNIEGATFGQDQARRNQYINETQTLRNSPLADYQAVMGMGGGVQQPNFINTPQGQVPMTDVTSPAMAAYQGQMNAYNQQQANSQATQGGLFGLAGTALGAGLRYGLPLLAGSDIRMKDNIRHIGHTHDGQRLYFFTYKGDPITPHVGLMAQEVEKVRPEAVVEIDGMKYVDYGRALGDG